MDAGARVEWIVVTSAEAEPIVYGLRLDEDHETTAQLLAAAANTILHQCYPNTRARVAAVRAARHDLPLA